MKYDKVFKIQF